MRFADLSRTRLAELAPDAVVVLPVGATEQHGPHLPTGTDHAVVERVALGAAAVVTDFPVLVAPTVAMGYSDHHLRYGATISVSADTLRAYLADCCRSLIGCGFRRVFVLNGHGGNVDVLGEVARVVSTETGCPVGSGSYWAIAWDELNALGASGHGRLPGHAGAFETSLAVAVRPDWAVADPPVRDWAPVPADPAPYPRYRIDDPGVWERNDGYSDNPAGADPDRGARYLEAIVVALARALGEFHGATEGGRST